MRGGETPAPTKGDLTAGPTPAAFGFLFFEMEVQRAFAFPKAVSALALSLLFHPTITLESVRLPTVY